ncbi:MAG TPA: DUF6782 family putative metallopeptidase [Acidimicrobiia bacterium]|nr:DUF6782 family putative metallopeptidase [Acidimicrobiia bacterium]
MHRRGVVWTAAVALAVATLLTSTTALAATPAPKEWDPRIEKYARFVERKRGLEFEHPVKVDFMGEQAFRRAASSWYDDITDKDRTQAALDGATLLALGLVTEPVDLLAAEESSDVEGTLGFYDDETGELVVRGTDLESTEVKLTIVHELTHALQDQRFDLGKLDSRTKTSGESAALTSLIEGDASLVERDYLWSLPQRVQDAYWDDQPVPAEGEGQGIAPDVASDPTWPAVLDLWTAVDYDLAPTALDLVVRLHGRSGLDRLFERPPTSEEQIIDPVALDQRDAPVRVALPEFSADETPQGKASDWGAFSWYLVLSSRLPWHQALTAVEGWGGDRSRNYTRTIDGVVQQCVRLAVTGDTAADTDQLHEAIADWAAAMPVGGAEVARDGDRVVLSACPTAQAPTSGDEAMETAYDRLWERTDQLGYLLAGAAPDAFGRCLADTVVADTDVEPLLYVERDLTRAENRRIQTALGAAADACR